MSKDRMLDSKTKGQKSRAFTKPRGVEERAEMPGITHLQQQVGNRALQQLISHAETAPPGGSQPGGKTVQEGKPHPRLSVIQCWSGGVHKELSKIGIYNVLTGEPGFLPDPNQVEELAGKSNDMDFRIAEIAFNAGAILGTSWWLNPLGRIFSDHHTLMVNHYRQYPARARNHGEGGEYWQPKTAGAALNAANQKMYEDAARALFNAAKNNPGGVSEGDRDAIYSRLGDALHVAQDRGSHGEGGIGMGHDNPEIECDDPGANPEGYQEAQQNTAAVIQNAMDYLTILLAAAPRANAPASAPGTLMARPAQPLQRAGEGPAELDDETSHRINSQRGGGQPLGDTTQRQAGQALGADFSGVRVHATAEADALNQQLNARAFTTGQDIFFREGAYQPGSSSGQELITHELAHVVQQSSGAVGGSGGRMTVNPPGDRFEQEADAAARLAAQAGGASQAQRQEMPEEEEEIQAKRLQRQEMPEEEEIQAKRLQRQEMPEEEEIQAKRLQRQEMPEEEEIQAKLLQRQENEEVEALSRKEKK